MSNNIKIKKFSNSIANDFVSGKHFKDHILQNKDSFETTNTLLLTTNTVLNAKLLSNIRKNISSKLIFFKKTRFQFLLKKNNVISDGQKISGKVFAILSNKNILTLFKEVHSLKQNFNIIGLLTNDMIIKIENTMDLHLLSDDINMCKYQVLFYTINSMLQITNFLTLYKKTN